MRNKKLSLYTCTFVHKVLRHTPDLYALNLAYDRQILVLEKWMDIWYTYQTDSNIGSLYYIKMKLKAMPVNQQDTAILRIFS